MDHQSSSSLPQSGSNHPDQPAHGSTADETRMQTHRARWIAILDEAWKRSVPESLVRVVNSGSDAAKYEFVRTFRDQAGHRRGVDVYFLAHLCGVEAQTLASEESRSLREDELFWLEAARASPDVARLPDAAQPLNSPLLREGTAPAWLGASMDDVPIDPRALTRKARTGGVEVWTQAELCCLHALAWVPGAWPRASQTATWLAEELQPDNATNHPWAVHVFAELGAQGNSTVHTQADMYAQTLLHNALVGAAAGGAAEVFSGLLLMDGARWLRKRNITSV
jgi:hypothetical protein